MPASRCRMHAWACDSAMPLMSSKRVWKRAMSCPAVASCKDS
jgi:hypothetical protein